MSGLSVGEPLAVYAVLSTSRAVGAPRLAARVLEVYRSQSRPEGSENEGDDV